MKLKIIPGKFVHILITVANFCENFDKCIKPFRRDVILNFCNNVAETEDI